MFKRIAVVVAALGFSSAASAGVITETMELNQYVGAFGSYDYTHDLNDDGFVPGSAESGEIAIEIFEDDHCQLPTLGGCLEEGLPEIVLVTIEEFDFDTGGITFGSGFSNELEVEALASLNADGLLDVEVRSLGDDFLIGNSTLSVVTDVAEPATLSLLGLGLLGLGTARRMRRA
ncbi:MAG: PEP-CTERM sorting domain-containing protein [Pseudomonadota bacterium]